MTWKPCPGVESVFSLVDVPLVKNVDGRLTDLEANLRMLSQDGVDKDRAREELLNSPLFKELIISADGGTTALRVELRSDSEFETLRKQRDQLVQQRQIEPLGAEDQAALSAILLQYDSAKKRRDDLRHQTIESVREIMDTYRSDAELHLGGVPMIADDMITYIKNDLVVFGVGVFVLLVAMLGIIFRRARWVLLPLASCVFSALLMIGVLGLAGWRVTVISSNFVSLMLIITMSMNIHLVVRYRQLRKDFPDCTQRELVMMTARKMVWPCFYTALTTIMAFASLVVSDIKPVIDFGWMMTIGLTVTFLTTFLLFPSILVLLNKTPAETESEGQYGSQLPCTRDRTPWQCRARHSGGVGRTECGRHLPAESREQFHQLLQREHRDPPGPETHRRETRRHHPHGPHRQLPGPGLHG